MTKRDKLIRVLEVVGDVLSHKEAWIGLMLLVGAFTLGPPFQAYQGRITAFGLAHPVQCGYLAYCNGYNTTITYVKDYTIECSTWFSVGSCPREDLGITQPRLFNQTINCQYYHLGDPINLTETFRYNAWRDYTNSSWSLGAHC